MGVLAYWSTVTATSGAAHTSEMHNVSVDEYAAQEGKCAQVHLPTGRMCTLPHGHRGSCVFIPAEVAHELLAHHGTEERQ